jgi:hypothetical protein
MLLVLEYANRLAEEYTWCDVTFCPLYWFQDML